MIAIDETPVEPSVGGEDPAPIIWRGRQWAVTEFGLERLNGAYSLSPSDLGNTGAESDFPSLPSHMAGKMWVDVHDFCTAFLVALALFPEQTKFTQEQIRKGLDAALEVGRRLEQQRAERRQGQTGE